MVAVGFLPVCGQYADDLETRRTEPWLMGLPGLVRILSSCDWIGPATLDRRARAALLVIRERLFFSQRNNNSLNRRGLICSAAHTFSNEKGPSPLWWKIHTSASPNSARLFASRASQFRWKQRSASM